MEPDCPPWCVTDAAEHEKDDPGAWLHEGPRFGLLRTWCLDGAEPVFSATFAEPVAEAGELDADELRQLATDALDAAMWMDRAARQVPGGSTGAQPSVVDLVRAAHARATRSA
ncbi:hypothetical protein L615_009200000020 [Nocardioides sp. J9]|uniref:hypothetical protein n=1 Tax=unclassified Nocardioides TaxID=2615069 RepID=UPI00119CC308|nr:MULTISPECIES: hypothetical protein [unclassified Nocardioides]TWG90168.1 hypothetical protein L615_009200000020 [Nocardioides sp. J9]